MKECPECGTSVSKEGNYCPECGAQLGDGSNGRSATRGQGAPDTGESDDWKYPVEESSSSTDSHPEDHKLLFGGVVGLSALALLEGLLRVLSPERVATELVETTSEAGLELEMAVAEQIVLGTGVVGMLIALAVSGLTVRNYIEGSLPNRYFWVLVATSVVGFLFASSIFLAFLLAFGIYGLVVLD